MVVLRPCVAVFLSPSILGLAVTANLRGEEPRRGASLPLPSAVGLKTPRLDQFDKYFALSIKPSAAALPHKADSHDILVIFDTSASQNGEFRTRGLATLRAFLSKLNPTDRVCLMAADTAVALMTTSETAGRAAATFVAPSGQEIDGAQAKLQRRVPLGATDMPLAMAAAVGAFQGQKNSPAARPRAIVYIGDG